jgi:hypothetical protein
MNQFDQFQNALLLETTSSNTFRVNPDDRYFVGKTPHGGYLKLRYLRYPEEAHQV